MSTVHRFDSPRQASLQTEFLSTAIDVSSADRGNIQLLEPSDATLRITVHKGFGKEFLQYFRVVKDTHSACGSAMSTMSRVVVSDVSSDAIFKGQKALSIMLKAQARACQSTPLISSSGRLFGVLSTHYTDPHDFTRREFGHLDTVVRHFTGQLEKHLHIPD